MKKFLLSIFAVMLAVFSVQAEEVTKSVTFSSYTAGTQYAKNEKHDLGDGLVIYTTECHFTSELRIYSSSTHNGYVVSDALPGTITKMTFNAGNKVDKLDIYGSNDGATWTKVGQVSVTSTSYKDYSLNFSGSYTRFKIDVNGANQVRLKSMSVTYIKSTGEGGGETPEPVDVAEPTFTPASGTTFEVDLDVTINTEDDLTVYYSTDEEKTYTKGNTVNITETTTVYAYAEDADGNKSDVVSAEYTKVVPVDPNAKEVEATISFASTAQRVSQDANKQVWANGGVTFTNNKASSSNDVANYSNPVRLYQNSNIVVEHDAMTKILFVCSESKYATALKNSIGNAATVSGSNVTVTFANPVNDFTVKLTAQVRLNSLTVTYITTEKVVKTPVITPESCGFYVGENVEVTITAEEGTIYYTLDGNEPTTSSEVYSAPFTVSETTTVKAIAVVDGTASEVTTVIYTKGIEGSVADALAAYVDGEKRLAVVTGYIVGYINGSAAGAEGKDCMFAVGGEMKNTNILIANDPNETDYTKCIAVQLPGNDIRTALNLVDNPDNLNKKVVIKGSLEKYLEIAGLKDLVVGELVAEEKESYTLAVGETKWATLYLDAAVAIPDGVEIWIVSEIADGYVELGEVVEVIPANCPVLVKAALADDYVFEYTNEAGDKYVNLLKGTTVNTYITEDAYVLTPDATSEVGVCFGKAIKNQLDGTAWFNNANKAYLPASGAASYSFRFGEGTTAIENVEVENEVKTIFDLTGRKLKGENGNLKGIYIINGKKVLVK